MLRKPAFIIILSLLVVSALILTYNLQPVNSDYTWTTTIYINADGGISPPTAPISSADNVTYTLTDNITEILPPFGPSAIIIQRDNIIIDGADHTLRGPYTMGSNSSSFWHGIDLTGRNNITIKNMKITTFDYGIWLNSSSINNSINNNISGNNITNNEFGIFLDSPSNNNNVSGNNITNNFVGIYLRAASDNSMSGNNITANSGTGLELDTSNNTIVSGNNITNNDGGILLISSSNNGVSGNNITGNSWAGVELDYSNNNSVSENNITDNMEGVCLFSSSSNSVSGNNITANGDIGVWLDSSSNNSVSGSDITANIGYGIFLSSSSNNTICHNDFMNNTSQVVSSSLANVWDDGYPSGGNFWSDYNGTDEHSGPSQTLPGYDGIGDVSYIIDGNNTDRYPFMQALTSQGVPIVQTPTGNNVTVSPTANVTITFANVTASGFTSWDTIQPPTDQFVSVTCNDIRTNASYTGNVTLEFLYDPDGLSLQDQQAMKIWLWNDSSACWVDITTSVNTTSHTVYGVSPHLSMFGVTSNLGITGDLSVSGTTTVSLPANPPAPPSSYWVALNYYQINTTKSLPAPISLSLAYNYQSLQPGQELSVRIMMWNQTSLSWDDITTSVDTTSHVVYGLAPHLSMFGVTCLQPSPTAGSGGGRMPYMN